MSGNMQPRRAKKRDIVEPAIIDALEAVGAVVLQIDALDLLVAFAGSWHVLECKTGRSKLNEKQVKLIAKIGERAIVHVVRTPEQALEAIGIA